MDELQISGKRFISSRRLARDHGYTADYLGQLIRGGKVSGQKVGRAWYVDAASFDAYLGGEKTLAELPEEKVLGSASPQPDHFLQEVPPLQVPAPAIESVPVVVPEKIKTVIEAPVHYIPLHIKTTETKPETGLRYYPDAESSLPEIRSNREVSIQAQAKIFEAPLPRRASKLPMIAFGTAALAVFIFSAVLSSALSLNLSIEAGNAAITWYSLNW